MNCSTGSRRWPAGPRTISIRAERGEGRDPVGRRIGMGQAAADRAAVAHRAIGDRAGDRGQGAIGGIGHAAVLDVGVGDAGADQKTVVLGLDAQQLGHGCDVDQQVGLRQAQIQHRPERLAAGQKLRRKVLALQQMRSHRPKSPAARNRMRRASCRVFGLVDRLEDAPRGDRRLADLGAERPAARR